MIEALASYWKYVTASADRMSRYSVNGSFFDSRAIAVNSVTVSGSDTPYSVRRAARSVTWTRTLPCSILITLLGDQSRLSATCRCVKPA